MADTVRQTHDFENGHAPDAQDERALAFPGQRPLAQGEAGAATATRALKVDNCFTGFGVPHFGQSGAVSARRRARCSNRFPHFLHLYS
ncbi:MAG: hypothetical protein A3K19_19100 [Lentisphaerae bacterium RIFOXYB12_FULL_65_16]|nr:MAG: hypothetical protein A3K19_19100 [Lentisphaerae bacterium RIFOXYB12_FULL_65_16]